MIANLFQKYREFIVYGIIGGTCALFDFCVYSLLCFCIPFLIANIISTHCGIFLSFFLNRKYNFKVKDKTFRRFITFYVVGLLGLGLSELLLFVCVNQLNIEKLSAKLITVFIVALIQFVLNKCVTFRK